MSSPADRRNPLPGLVAALLPSPERDRFAIRFDAEPYYWSLGLGLAELFLGGKAMLNNAIHTYQTLSDALATHVVEHGPQVLGSFEGRLAFNWSGVLIWITWLSRPLTWLLISIPLVGIARLFTAAITEEAFGEPLVWVGLRVPQGIRHLTGLVRHRRHFGPLRPDRVLVEPGSALIVLTPREKEGWNELVTYEVDGRFYRLVRLEERPDRGWNAYAYLLREEEPNEVIRSLIRYEPPGEDAGKA